MYITAQFSVVRSHEEGNDGDSDAAFGVFRAIDRFRFQPTGVLLLPLAESLCAVMYRFGYRLALHRGLKVQEEEKDEEDNGEERWERGSFEKEKKRI